MGKYKHILVIGPAGSGKTTFSTKLANKINIEVIHLDKIYWEPNWVRPDEAKWQAKVDEILKKEQWILDGNYKTTFEKRLVASDLVIFLDINRFECIYGIIKRINKTKKNKQFRDDLANGCTERFDYSFIKWSWDFKKKYRPFINECLLKYPNKTIKRFKTRKSAYKFLEKFTNEI